MIINFHNTSDLELKQTNQNNTATVFQFHEGLVFLLNHSPSISINDKFEEVIN